MNKIALAATLALALCGSAQGRLVEVASEPRSADSSTAVRPQGIVVLQSATSDLDEPAMIGMMLLGLCLIGYRATRDSSEKFK